MEAPRASSELVSRVMKGNRSAGTKPELTLSRLLRKRPRRSALPGRPDLVYPKARLAVFVHGCFWHRCPLDAPAIPRTHSAYWRKKLERNVKRDRFVREQLVGMGWRVVEVWEHELKADPRAAAARVRALARQRF